MANAKKVKGTKHIIPLVSPGQVANLKAKVSNTIKFYEQKLPVALNYQSMSNPNYDYSIYNHQFPGD